MVGVGRCEQCGCHSLHAFPLVHQDRATRGKRGEWGRKAPLAKPRLCNERNTWRMGTQGSPRSTKIVQRREHALHLEAAVAVALLSGESASGCVWRGLPEEGVDGLEAGGVGGGGVAAMGL
eukprot:scaffold4717_cov109-Isochrysis_galbana.AAC.9